MRLINADTLHRSLRLLPLPFILLFAICKGLQPVECLHITSLAVFCTAICPLFLIILLDKEVKVNPLLLSFLFVCMVSLLSQPMARVFHAWERLGFFTLMLGLLSPLLQNRMLSQARPVIWRTMMWCLRAIVLCSLIIYIGRWLDIQPFSQWRLMGFRGVTSGGMSLAPICAIVFIDLVWRLGNTPVCRPRFWSFLAAAGLTLTMMVHAGSRIAIAGTVVATAIIIYHHRDRLKNIRRHYRAAAIILLAAVAFCAALPYVSETVRFKFHIAAVHHSLTISRDGKWQDRLEELKSSPWTGIGYSTQTEFNSIFDNKRHTYATGQTEPGSAWLAVLAQTGIIGFLLITIFNINLCRLMAYPINRGGQHSDDSVLMLSFLVFLWINGVAEGWLLYPGSAMFFPYWTLSGIIYDRSSSSNPELTSGL